MADTLSRPQCINVECVPYQQTRFTPTKFPSYRETGQILVIWLAPFDLERVETTFVENDSTEYLEYKKLFQSETIWEE